MTSPDRNGEIFVGRGDHTISFSRSRLANRHGFGHWRNFGTGKTVTLAGAG